MTGSHRVSFHLYTAGFKIVDNDKKYVFYISISALTWPKLETVLEGWAPSILILSLVFQSRNWLYNRKYLSICLSIRLSVCLKTKPFNSLKSSFFIIHLSSFIILHSSFIILHHSSSFFIHPSFISRLLSFSACFWG